MALLNKGELVFSGSPENLVKHDEGHVFKLTLNPYDYERVKEHYNVISTIPVESGWEVQIVSDIAPDFSYSAISPNIEHAYVYFMEHTLHTEITD